MTAVINYIILPFVAEKSGAVLRPGTPQRAKSKTKAVAAAERMAGQYAGIVVLEEFSDPEHDIYDEPQLVTMIGRVPTEMIAALAA